MTLHLRDCTLKRLALIALSGLLIVAAHANPLQREPSERARREADNPMRVIIDAAATKRAARPVEATAPAVPAKRSGSGTGNPAPTPVTVITAPSKALTPRSRSPAEDVSTPDPPATRAVETASSPSGNLSITSAPNQADSPDKAKPPEWALPVLRLIHKVNPVFPEALQSQILEDIEITVRMGIDPDGLVYRVEVPPDTLAGLEAPIQNALRRWRFDPISEPVTATVVLVFRPAE